MAESPPVCVDVGASGTLPAEWRLLAPHSICIAFDADTREFRIDDSATSRWKRLIKLNRLVGERRNDAVDFFLTRSPYCSSALEPNDSALEPWAFSGLFDVEQKVSLPAIGLSETLAELGITRIDWYKSDTQGMDVRIFASLSNDMISQVIAADFEPGIIDAYVGEDKLFTLLQFMEGRPFFVSDMKIWGSQRIGDSGRRSLGAMRTRFLSSILKISPGWSEITYLNDFSAPPHSKRKIALGWVIASIKEQDGHALSIAESAVTSFGDPIFEECRDASLSRMRSRYPELASHLLKRGLRRILGR